MSLKILDNVMPMLSPTQVESAGCERAWYYKYVEGIPTAVKSAQVAGSEIDKLVTQAIRTKEKPTSQGWGPVALAALRHLEKTGCIPQAAMQGIPFARALFGGYDEGRLMAIDVLDEVRIDEPEARDKRGNPIPLVMDLKTTGDKKWVKTKEQLETDLQLLVYARAASIRFLSVRGYLPEYVDCRWCYVVRDKEKPRVYPVELKMTQKMIDTGEKLWQDKITRVLNLALAKSEGTLKKEDCAKNPAKCNEYGGCSYGPRHKGVCDLTLQEEIMTQTLSNEQIQQMLMANGIVPPTQNGGGAQTPAPVQAQQPPQQPQTLMPVTGMDLQNPQQALQAQAQMQALLAQQQQAHAQAQAQQLAQQHAQGTVQGYPQTAPNYTPEMLQAFLQSQGLAGVTGAVNKPQAPAPAASTQAPVQAQGEPPRRRRGRPSKAEIAARNAAAGITTIGNEASDEDDETEELAHALETLSKLFGKAASALRGE